MATAYLLELGVHNRRLRDFLLGHHLGGMSPVERGEEEREGKE